MQTGCGEELHLIYLLGSGVQAAAGTAAENSTQALRDLSMHAVRMEQLSESRDEQNARLIAGGAARADLVLELD